MAMKWKKATVIAPVQISMLIATNKGETMRLIEPPRYSEFHKRFYATGFRLIKSRNEFSKTALVHNFESFEYIEAPAIA